MSEQIVVRIVNVEKSTATNRAGKPYDVYEVIHKVNFRGETKTDSKKLMGFTLSPEIKKVLESAKSGEVYTVTREKNNDGYWEWKGMDLGSEVTPQGEIMPQAAIKVAGKYDMAAENAARQRSIERQACLKASIEYCAIGKEPVGVDTVLAIAEDFYDWVNKPVNVEE